MPIPRVTNQVILEIHSLMNGSRACTYYILWRWVSCLVSGQRKREFPTVKSIRLSARLSTLKKMPSSGEKFSAITEFLNEPYTLPRVFISHGKVFVSSSDESSCSPCSSCGELRCLSRNQSRKYMLLTEMDRKG